MTIGADKRLGLDRRRKPRGGRRSTDAAGTTPLVMVIEPDARRSDITEAILAKLRFAVAPVDSVDKAVTAIQSLHPEVIVSSEDVRRIVALVPAATGIPIVAIDEDTRTTDALIDAVRRALRD
jgi:hypothetical protein